MKNKASIIALREKIPVGISAAIKLLERTSLDLAEAERLWKTEQVNLLAGKIAVDPDEAKTLLEFMNYDFAKALSLFRERNTSDVERILESSKKEQEILANFWVHISEKLGDDVTYGGWITLAGFEQLPELVRDILTVWQWYAYYDYEGISVEQATTELVIDILELKLALPEFAAALKCLKEMTDKLNDAFNEHDSLEKRIELRNRLVGSEPYKLIDDKIEQMEDLVMKATYAYLYENAERIDSQITTDLPPKSV